MKIREVVFSLLLLSLVFTALFSFEKSSFVQKDYLERCGVNAHESPQYISCMVTYKDRLAYVDWILKISVPAALITAVLSLILVVTDRKTSKSVLFSAFSK